MLGIPKENQAHDYGPEGPWAVIKKCTNTEILGHLHTCTHQSSVKILCEVSRALLVQTAMICSNSWDN